MVVATDTLSRQPPAGNGKPCGRRPLRIDHVGAGTVDVTTVLCTPLPVSSSQSPDKIPRPSTVKVSGSEDEAVKPGPAAVSASAE